jgi:hypothetical protein
MPNIHQKMHIGQTSWTFQTQYKEHIQNIKNNKGNTGFSCHILSAGHYYGKIGCIKNSKDRSLYE